MTHRGPLFSVVTPVYEPPLDVLRETIRSVREQTFTDWELILVDDRSPSPEVRAELRRAAGEDARIRVHERSENGGIVAASNDAVALARGRFLALLDHDDLFAPHALATMAGVVRGQHEVDYVYSDEDKLDANGRYFDVFCKPDWSPERLRHQMYACHLSVLRTSLVRAVGGFHEGFDGSQDHDLVLRVTERARRIVHVPEVLYHWRLVPGSTAVDTRAKPQAWENGRRAVQAHLDRVGLRATAELGLVPGWYRIRRSFDALPSVSLVIPTRGSAGLVWGEPRTFVVEAVRSALARTAHTDVEVVVVYDVPAPPGMLEQLREICGDRLVAVPYAAPFNFSVKCNLGMLASSGEVIVLLNDDVEAASDNWLEELVAPLTEPDVGMTGAKLLFSNGTLQHGGHAYRNGHLGHAHTGVSPRPEIDFGGLYLNREASGVTAACAALRRGVFDEVGGLTEKLPVNFNDVDLSMKVRAAGYRILWMADAVLYHFESRTREPVVQPFEYETIVARWGTPVRDRYAPTA